MKRLRTMIAGTSALALAGSMVVTIEVPAGAASGSGAFSAIAQVAQGTAATPYKVTGRMVKAYKKYGGAKKIGKPIDKANCRLPERACLQHFTKGTIYLQRNGKAWATGTKGTRGDVLVVARSQVGFKQKNLKVRTKYSRYTGEVATRWCNDFHSWTAYASGHRELIPKIPVYAEMKKWMRANWKRLKKPTRGTYVMLNGSRYQSHMAVVWAVLPGNKIRILEGNWGYSVMMRTVPIAKSMEFRTPYGR